MFWPLHTDRSKEQQSPVIFKAYKEELIEKNQSKQDMVLEVSIIEKFGGLYLADPNLDNAQVVLRINTERVNYQLGKKGPNQTYCVYGMAAGEVEILETISSACT
jgi:hypothetical protein